MSELRLNQVAVPSAPASGKSSVFVDTVDRMVKAISDKGILSVLGYGGWRDRPVAYNGSFEFAQRQVPTTLTTYSSVGGRIYGPDRWWTSNENASIQFRNFDTASAVEAGLNSRYYGQFSKLTTLGKFMFGQTLAASSILQMRGNRVRLQFLIKGSSAYTVRMGLIQLQTAGTTDSIPLTAGNFVTVWGANTVDPTMGANLARLTPVASSEDGGTISGAALSCVLSTSWARFSCCFDVPSDCKNLILAVWTDSQVAAGVTLGVGEEGLYEGPELRPNFVMFPTSLELLRCQRYYQKTFALATAPAQSAGVTGALRGMVAIAAAVATSSTMQWRFGVPLRVAPVTTTFYNPSAANAFVRNVPAATDATVTAAASATEFGLDVNATGLAAWTVGQELKVHCTVDAEV